MVVYAFWIVDLHAVLKQHHKMWINGKEYNSHTLYEINNT